MSPVSELQYSGMTGQAPGPERLERPLPMTGHHHQIRVLGAGGLDEGRDRLAPAHRHAVRAQSGFQGLQVRVGLRLGEVEDCTRGRG